MTVPVVTLVAALTLGLVTAPFADLTDAARHQLVMIDTRTHRVTGAVARSFSTGIPRSPAVVATQRGWPLGAEPNERRTVAVSLGPCASPVC